jgi:DNA-binding transcriptional LysR family regulator
MELRHIKYFLVLAEELSFVNAADRLCISQPPLSRQIKEMEDEMGTRLFHRNNKRVELTEAGKFFQKEAQQIVEALEKASRQTKKIGDNVSGEFRIGYISSTFSGHITKLIKQLSDQYPYLKIKLYEVATAKQILALEQSKLDLGIIRGPIVSTKLSTSLWFRDSFSIVYNKNKITLHSEKELKKLKNERFIFFNKAYAPNYYNTLVEICSTFGFIPEVDHESNNVSSILQLVREGLGVSILPTNAVKNNTFQELSFLQLKSIPQYSEVLLATPQNENSIVTSKAIAFLLKSLKK